MKISANAPCPCHNGKKYKQCCHPYHKGILPATALLLMRSRYSAFALGLPEYIIRTTHPDNPDYTEDKEKWSQSIHAFSRSREFKGLSILEFIDGESVAYVTFKAVFADGSFTEKSRFFKVAGVWLYESGEFRD